MSAKPQQHPVHRRRLWLWALLVLLLLVAQSLLVLMTQRYEGSRRQQQAHAQSAEVAARVRQLSNRDVQAMQGLLWTNSDTKRWREDAAEQLRRFRPMLRVESRDAQSRLLEAVSSPYRAPIFQDEQRQQFQVDTDLACASALRRQGSPQYSRSYFVPRGDGEAGDVVDICQARVEGGVAKAYLVATLSLSALLDEALTPEQAHGFEFSFIDGDGSRLARSGLVRGLGVYRSERLIELPGLSLMLRVDSVMGPPGFIPTLSTALVMGLSFALLVVVALLARDGRRRALAERRLAQSLAFRQAMENSLIAGLRARDMDGNISYVNKAFCAIVGREAQDLLGQRTPPYWPPEFVESYRNRLRDRNALVAEHERRGIGESESWKSFETVFMRADGERFPVVIYEAPLRDADGIQTGWMSAVLDISEQQRMEEFTRAQADRLQATARLAAVGEMASLISHEVNQPLAAIASYATASRNLLSEGHADVQTLATLRRTSERIAEQAERAGRVIKSVHDFVRRRERAHETLPAAELIDAVLPLVRMQARKGGIRIAVEGPDPSPTVYCDRTLVEQVLLNLARNAIQAMESSTPPGARLLTLGVSLATPRWVAFTVRDQGPGIPPEIGRKLFTPFYTTRSEGMGLGLSLCRTVVEQHGGAMDFRNHETAGGISGCEFRFTLPATTGSAIQGTQ